jgi:uncharacterized protein (DUF488 family)
MTEGQAKTTGGRRGRQHEREPMSTLFTIGFAEKSAEEFFDTLTKHKVRIVVDIRLNNKSQLAGFTKRDDLKYFLKELAGIEYVHDVDLAPTDDILKAYRNNTMSWSALEQSLLALVAKRKAISKYAAHDLDRACLLCSEHEPMKCHRSLIAELFSKRYKIAIKHL